MTDARTCEGCGRLFERRRTETRRQFDERRFCSRRCSARRPRAGYRGKRERVAARCATCEAEFEIVPSRLERSRSGLLYCSIECQAADRTPGGPLHHPVSVDRQHLAEDAESGRYSVADLAQRHDMTTAAVTATLHALGVSLTRSRTGRKRSTARVRSPLADRVDALYMKQTGASSPHGSRKWFAPLVGVGVAQLARILSGRYPADRVVEVLRRMEVQPPPARSP